MEGCITMNEAVNITINGDLALCCNDYNHRHLFGNLKEHTLDSLLSGAAYTNIKKTIWGGGQKAPTTFICRHCVMMDMSFERNQRIKKRRGPLFMRIMLPIVPEGGHLYLQSDILHSLLKTKITDEIWSGRPIQYVRVFHQGPLIYTNGYVKIYNETDRPERINRYFNITNPDCTDVKKYNGSRSPWAERRILCPTQSGRILDRKKHILADGFIIAAIFLIYGFDDQKREIYAASHDRNTRYTVFVLTYKLLDEIYDAGKEGKAGAAGHNRCQYIRLNDRLENDEAFQYSETKWKTDIERHLKRPCSFRC